MRNLLAAVFCFCVLLGAASEALAQGGSKTPAAKRTRASKQTPKKKAVEKKPDDFIIQMPFHRTRKPRPIQAENNAPVVENLAISRTELSVNSSEADLKINVSIKVFDQENDVLVYIYKASGGKIIGHGADVIWDLSGLKPGTYTISVSADDGCGACSNTLTKEVKIVE